MRRIARVLVTAAVAALLAVALFAYFAASGPAKTNTGAASGYVTGTSVETGEDTFLASCTEVNAGFSLRVVSDSTGAPIAGESVNAEQRFGCTANAEQIGFQTVYLDNFSVGEGGWLTPVWPAQAFQAGMVNFTIAYQGKPYDFSAAVPLIGWSCITLRVPSGNVTQVTLPEAPCS